MSEDIMKETKSETSPSETDSSAEGSITESKQYKALLSESIERRNIIKAQKAELTALTEWKTKQEEATLSKEEKLQKQIGDFQTQIQSKDAELNRNRIGMALAKEVADGFDVNDVADIFMKSNTELTDESVAAFKEAKPGYFKKAETGPIRTPGDATTVKSESNTAPAVQQDVDNLQNALLGMKEMDRMAAFKKLDPEMQNKISGLPL